MSRPDRLPERSAPMRRTDGPTRSRASYVTGKGLVVPCLVGVLGFGLLALAIPRTVAAWLAYNAEPALAKLQDDQQPTDRELVEGIEALSLALSWNVSGRRLTDLGVLQLQAALLQPQQDARRATLLEDAEQHLLRGLSENPVDAFAWLRLAIVRDQREATPRKVATALAQSLDMGPNVRSLWVPRMSMLLAYWRYLTVDELLAMGAQLRTIWDTEKDMRVPVMRAAARVNEVPMVAWALGNNPENQREFEKLRAGLR